METLDENVELWNPRMSRRGFMRGLFVVGSAALTGCLNSEAAGNKPSLSMVSSMSVSQSGPVQEWKDYEDFNENEYLKSRGENYFITFDRRTCKATKHGVLIGECITKRDPNVKKYPEEYYTSFKGKKIIRKLRQQGLLYKREVRYLIQASTEDDPNHRILELWAPFLFLMSRDQGLLPEIGIQYEPNQPFTLLQKGQTSVINKKRIEMFEVDLETRSIKPMSKQRLVENPYGNPIPENLGKQAYEIIEAEEGPFKTLGYYFKASQNCPGFYALRLKTEALEFMPGERFNMFPRVAFTSKGKYYKNKTRDFLKVRQDL